MYVSVMHHTVRHNELECLWSGWVVDANELASISGVL